MTDRITTPFTLRVHRRRGHRRHRPHRPPRRRHRRRVRHRRRDRTRAGRCRRRGHPRRARRRARASATAARHRRHHRQQAGARRPARPRRPGLGRGIHRRLGRPAAHPGQQRRGHGLAAEMRTPQGWEMQFATNHLGHFALDHRPAPGAGARAAAPGSCRSAPARTCARRSSSTTSTSTSRPYDPWSAYGQSKTANVLFAVEADQALGRRRDHRQRADARRDPHQPAAPRLRGGAGADARRRRRARRRWKTPEQGAATSVLVGDLAAARGRRRPLFRGLQRGRGRNQPGTRNGVAAYALDPEAAARLWQESVKTLAG